MKNRNLKKLEEKLAGAADVPDGVLDAARDEMRRRGPKEPAGTETRRMRVRKGSARGGAVAVGRRAAVWCAVAVLVVLIAATAVFLSVRFSSATVSGSDDAVGYSVSELERESITSVEEYNVTHSTSYLSYAGGSECFVYRSGTDDVMLEQDFVYGGAECILYIVVDEDDDVDVLSVFRGLSGRMSVYGRDVRCGGGEGNLFAEAHIDGSRYCLSVGSDDENVMSALLGEILA